jgi:NADP-reducing hydrogenase subunit HndA
MAKRKTAVPFQGTAEQEKQLKELITSHKDMQGALMPVLQEAQEIYGYLPIEVQTMIAEGLDIPLEEVYGVATFYGQFNLNPKGKYQIAVCLGTACYVRGAGAVLERIEQKLGVERGGITPDGVFSLDATRCLGACGLAPVMTINGEVYGRLVPSDVDRILDQYINA